MSTEKPKPSHPNRIPVEGLLTLLDVPSDMAPAGSQGRRVILTTEAARAALWSLEGMALNFTMDYEGHDLRRKCGVITGGFIQGNELRIAGYLYGRDFGDVVEKLRDPAIKMGMSYDVCSARVLSKAAPVWTLTELIFTGAAVLLAEKAAYHGTTFTLSAAGEVFDGRMSFVTDGTLKLGD